MYGLPKNDSVLCQIGLASALRSRMIILSLGTSDRNALIASLVQNPAKLRENNSEQLKSLFMYVSLGVSHLLCVTPI